LEFLQQHRCGHFSSVWFQHLSASASFTFVITPARAVIGELHPLRWATQEKETGYSKLCLFGSIVEWVMPAA
jgi:hypothetical protein